MNLRDQANIPAFGGPYVKCFRKSEKSVPEAKWVKVGY